MDTRRLIDLLRSRDAFPDPAVLRAAADRLERQEAELVRQSRRVLDLGREVLVAEGFRLQLEARNRELLARCDLLSHELAQSGRHNPVRSVRPLGEVTV